jgi:hypothetical protein
VVALDPNVERQITDGLRPAETLLHGGMSSILHDLDFGADV